MRGILKVGEIIEIRPGIISKNCNGDKIITPIYSRIVSLKAENNDLIYAIPGGLIGVGLKVDPSIARGDSLAGKILGYPGKLPEIYVTIIVKIHLLKRVLGIKRTEKDIANMGEIKIGEILLVNAGSTSVGAKVKEINKDNKEIITFEFSRPICCEISEKIAISRKYSHAWRLIGWGEVLFGGKTIPSS